MSFNTGATPGFWGHGSSSSDQVYHQGNPLDFDPIKDDTGYSDICELNQENVRLLNSQHQFENSNPVNSTLSGFQQPYEYSLHPLQFQTREEASHGKSGLGEFYQASQFPFPHPANLNSNSNSNSIQNKNHNHNQIENENGQHIGVDSGSSESSPQTSHNHNMPTPSTSEASGNFETDSYKLLEKPTTTTTTANKGRKSASSQKSKKRLLDEQDAILIARDDSELTDEELQLKRKAQNRAAQRAFRERKETKLKELEAKLLQSEGERQRLMEELDNISKQNLSITTENEILKTSDNSNLMTLSNSNNPVTKFDFPQTQDAFIAEILRGNEHHLKPAYINKVYDDSQGKKLLALGAVWDYLQIKAEEANLDSSSIDFVQVMEKLRGNEKCHGYGPAYTLESVDQAIRESFH
ncbi:uncharacterized protein LODBEIA_P56510 [Lodderomyces beijingensis]|uniref:BZIP domain-containing protein n=1 Tax=Lodderomyces beijingensis TaxID=1775926 RepID=A0ABP0ZTI4_9ASCO